MKASELIEELQRIINRDGDLDVYDGNGVEICNVDTDTDIDKFIVLDAGV